MRMAPPCLDSDQKSPVTTVNRKCFSGILERFKESVRGTWWEGVRDLRGVGTERRN